MSYRLSAFAHMHQLILLRGNLAGLGQPVGSFSVVEVRSDTSTLLRKLRITATAR
jgi:hypothetical protein